MHIQKILQLSEVRLVAAVAYYEGPARIIRGVNGRSSGLWPQESGTRYCTTGELNCATQVSEYVRCPYLCSCIVFEEIPDFCQRAHAPRCHKWGHKVTTRCWILPY